jgi:hypothetical protein
MELMWLFVGSMIAVVCVCNVLHWREISKHFDDNEEE